MLVADASGNVVRKIAYDSFGNIIEDTNPAFAVPFGFAGGLHDRDTGLVRFGYRDYDPDTGRWTAKDPIFFAGGDTDLFGYCVNDPVNLTDLKGLQWFHIFGDSYDFGRVGAFIQPGDSISIFIEDHIAHMALTADIHDPVVGILTNIGVPDLIANYPTMVPSYAAACITNNLTDYDYDNDNNNETYNPPTMFILFEIRW